MAAEKEHRRRKKGDIVLLRRFPVLNYRKRKNRPVLILIDRENDVTAAFITTQLQYKEDHDILLEPSKGSGLTKKSVVLLSKIGTVDKELILGKLGSLSKSERKQLDEKLVEVLGIEKG